MSQSRNAIRGIVCIAGLALACASSGGAPTQGATAENPAAKAGLGVGSVLASVLYAPAKIVYATGGAIVGGLAWILTGGDREAAMAVFRPSMTGDYLVTPDHLRDPGSIEFIGRGAAPPSIASVAAAPPSSARVCASRSSVAFATGATTLDAAARRQLDGVVLELRRCPDQLVRIRGYADATGEALHNQELSERRARAVEDYLVERGLERSRVAAKGKGTSNPVSSNATAEGRAANRRAEIALVPR